MVGFTTKWFHNAFSNTELIDALKRSAWIGVAAAIGATLLGLITAVGMTAHKLRLRGLVTALVLLPLVIPYIVLAVGLLILLNWLGLQRRSGPCCSATSPSPSPIASSSSSRACARSTRRSWTARDLGADLDGVQARDPAADHPRALQRP